MIIVWNGRIAGSERIRHRIRMDSATSSIDGVTQHVAPHWSAAGVKPRTTGPDVPTLLEQDVPATFGLSRAFLHFAHLFADLENSFSEGYFWKSGSESGGI